MDKLQSHCSPQVADVTGCEVTSDLVGQKRKSSSDDDFADSSVSSNEDVMHCVESLVDLCVASDVESLSLEKGEHVLSVNSPLVEQIPTGEKVETLASEEKTESGGQKRGDELTSSSAKVKTSDRLPACSLVPYRLNEGSSDSEVDSESDSDSDSEESSESSSSSSSSDSSSTSLSENDNSDEESGKSNTIVKKSGTKPFRKSVKTEGELGLEDLPPIQELHISLQKHERIQIGFVHAIVDTLAVVQSLPDSPALDLDSVLFLEDGTPMGQVFDVLGLVTNPLYAVRFNSVEDIQNKGLIVGTAVFYAPKRKDLTSFVFLEQLQKMKGSDASWKDNNEPPEEHLDYSDDETERQAKAKLRSHRKGKESDPQQGKQIQKPNKKFCKDAWRNSNVGRKSKQGGYSREMVQSPQRPLVSPATFRPPVVDARMEPNVLRGSTQDPQFRWTRPVLLPPPRLCFPPSYPMMPPMPPPPHLCFPPSYPVMPPMPCLPSNPFLGNVRFPKNK